MKRRARAITVAAAFAGGSLAAAQSEPPRLGRFLWQTTEGLRDPVDVAFLPDGRPVVLDRWPVEVVMLTASGGRAEAFAVNLPIADAMTVLDDGGIVVAGDGRVIVLGSGGAPDREFDLAERIGAISAAPGGLAASLPGLRAAWLVDESGAVRAAVTAWGSDAAPFIRPDGIGSLGASGLIVADAGDDRILRIDSADESFSFSGFGSFPGRVSRPSGVAVRGDLAFIADSQNHRINVYREDGSFLYDWGLHVRTPREGEGRLHYPSRIAVNTDGTMAAVLEPLERRVQAFGAVGGESPAPDERGLFDGSAALHFGEAIAAAGDLMATTEPDTGQVVISTLARGTPIELTRIGRRGKDIGLFRDPTDVAIDLDRRRIIVADAMSRRVSVFELDWNPSDPPGFDPFMARLVRSYDIDAMRRERWAGAGPAELRAVGGLPDGSLLVAGERQVFRILLNGDLDEGWTREVFNDVADLSVDVRGGIVCVLDRGPAGARDEHVGMFAIDGTRVGMRPVDVRDPGGVAHAGGVVVVTDRVLDRVVLVNDRGEASAVGGPGLGRVEFSRPSGVAALPDGGIVVVDRGNHRLQFLEADGTFSSAFGSRVYVRPTEVEGGSR